MNLKDPNELFSTPSRIFIEKVTDFSNPKQIINYHVIAEYSTGIQRTWYFSHIENDAMDYFKHLQKYNGRIPLPEKETIGEFNIVNI